jgi:hypothetical protein
VQLVKDVFQTARLYVSSNRHLIFVCGGESSKRNLRSKFLKYASKELPHLRLILAEDAYRDLMGGSRPAFVNLAVFEELIAELADCVVLFPESFGSVAELGFFVANEKIATKLLTVNPIKYQAHDSFVNLGPIALINVQSNFRPGLLLGEEKPTDFSAIAERLKRYAGERRRVAFAYQQFDQYGLLEKFFAIFEIVRHVRIVHVATLPYVIEKIFAVQPVREELKNLISVLVAARYIIRAGEESRYLVASEAKPFLDIPKSGDLLEASNNYLLANHKQLYSQIFTALEAT